MRPAAVHHPFATPFSGRADLGTLLYLQRTAGNAAVASLVEAQRRPLHVQRCAGRACDCSPDERRDREEDGAMAVPIQRSAAVAPPETLPVQRGFLDALTGAASSLLPEPIKAVLTGSAGQANAAAHELREKGSHVSEAAHAEGGHVLESSSASAEAAAKKTEGEMHIHAEEAHAVSSKAVASGDATTSETQAAAVNLQSVGTAAAAVMNPVGPIIELPAFRDALNHVVSVLSAIPGGVADLAADLKSGIHDGLTSGQKGGWNCDQAQIMAAAGGVSKALATAGVKAGKSVLGDERYEALEGWAHERVGDLKVVAAGIRAHFARAKEMLQHFWATTFVPLLTKLHGMLAELGKLKDRLTAWVGEEFGKVKKLATDTWTAIRTNVVEPVVAQAHAAKQKVTKLVADARAAIGSWWEHLPGPAKDLIVGLGVVIAAPFALALSGAEKAKEALISAAESLVHRLKQASDGVLQVIAARYQSIRKWVTKASGSFKKRWAAIREKVEHYLTLAAAAVDGASGGRISKLMAELADMKKTIGGQACAALGDTAGPCVNQFVPNPGQGESADVTLSSNAAVTVPVYGVPVKVGKGASVKVSREGHDSRKYKVTETGDGLIAVTAPTGEGSGTASLDIVGPMGGGFNAWESLTGKTVAKEAAAGAAAGAAAAPEQKGPEIEAEAGYKGSVDMTYTFDPDKKGATTCDGLGGLTALLGAQGLSTALPPPFSSMGDIVASSFSDNVTSCIVTLAQYGKASVNVKQDGLGGVEAAVNAQASASVERSKDKNDQWIDSATIKESLGGSVAAKLATGGSLPLKLSAEAGETASAFVKLEYREKENEIKALSAGAKLALSLDLDPGKIQAVLPDSVAGPVLAELTPYLKSPKSGSLEIEASYSVGDLDKMLTKLDLYLNQQPPEKVTTDGLFETLADYVATADIKQALTVKLKTSRLIGKGQVDIDAKEAAVKGGVALEEHRSRTIYAYPAGAGGED